VRQGETSVEPKKPEPKPKPKGPGHVFPVRGPFDFGGPGSRFGASRGDHVHQGQDIAAASGTPVVAVRRGVISWRAYQASGAGHYLVLDAAGENRDYVFMHLRSGSIVVGQGDRVRTGQRIAQVGSTGSSTGPHLHFEVWVGEWFDGGHPVDPLPLLRRWLR
jgi:murein DD-endopeptidase MepM/ murein hydrolase activator NlpD